jgi:hypothetical protein
MLNLTDMWRAAGSDMAKRPINWLGSVEAKNFQEFLEIQGVGNSDRLVFTEKGNPRKRLEEFGVPSGTPGV